METQNKIELPFTLYDIFGYLMPGLAVILLLVLAADFPTVMSLIASKSSFVATPPKLYFNLLAEFFYSSPWLVPIQLRFLVF